MNIPGRTTRLVLVCCAWFLLSTCFLGQRSGAAQTSANQGASARERANAGQSGEDETGQFRHSPSVQLLSKITGLSLEGAYWLAVVLNFAIVAAAIAWLAKKNLPHTFRMRTATIQKSLEEARRASEDASRRLAEVENRLRHLDDEIAQLQAASEKESAGEEERIRAAATEEVRRILDSAEQEIAAAARLARRELTEYAADLAVSLAGKQIQVPPPSDEMLVRRFAQQLSSEEVLRRNA
ncbi:MAG: ATP synthase F0 subunit B [Acidobacteria bacterium]|nr:ATP synthase F0 subunit B [Acidobacteriota bacterium]